MFLYFLYCTQIKAKEGDIIQTTCQYTGKMKEIIVVDLQPITEQKTAAPYDIMHDEALNACFGGGIHPIRMRKFLSYYFINFAAKDVVSGDKKKVTGRNFHFDWTSLNTLQEFKKSIPQDKTVFDIGCGQGLMSILFTIAGAKKVIAYDQHDLSKEINDLWDIADKYGIITDALNKPEFVIADVTSSDFHFPETDTIWMGRSLSMMNPNQITTLAPKIKKSLKADGDFFMSVHSPGSYNVSKPHEEKLNLVKTIIKTMLNDKDNPFPGYIHVNKKTETTHEKDIIEGMRTVNTTTTQEKLLFDKKEGDSLFNEFNHDDHFFLYTNTKVMLEKVFGLDIVDVRSLDYMLRPMKDNPNEEELVTSTGVFAHAKQPHS